MPAVGSNAPDEPAEGPTDASARDPARSPAPAATAAEPADETAGSLPGALADAVAGERSLTRRQLLRYAGAGAVGLGGWEALDNVLLGYGVVAGTNLLEQDLAAHVREDLGVRSGSIPVGDYEVRTDGESVGVYEGQVRHAEIDLSEAALADARLLDGAFDLHGDPATQLFEDLTALRDGRYRLSFSTSDSFFERIGAAAPRPATVAALRGPAFDGPDPELVGEFAGVNPADTRSLVTGLAEGFREHTGYDLVRYLAGSVEDNVLFGRGDLRERFESPSDFESVAAGENEGLFCTELAARSIEAFHARSPLVQSPPVFAGFVADQRHKHAYTVLASVVREDGELVLPATFLDYTHSTLFDDLRLRWLLGEGVEAYDDRHRTTGVYWNRTVGF